MITLTDTSDDTIDLHINDWMVENELAEWGKMVCIKYNTNFQRYRKYFPKSSSNLRSLESRIKLLCPKTKISLKSPTWYTQNYFSYAMKKTALKNYLLTKN
jgi:hypothetical protein